MEEVRGAWRRRAGGGEGGWRGVAAPFEGVEQARAEVVLEEVEEGEEGLGEVEDEDEGVRGLAALVLLLLVGGMAKPWARLSGRMAPRGKEARVWLLVVRSEAEKSRKLKTAMLLKESLVWSQRWALGWKCWCLAFSR